MSEEDLCYRYLQAAAALERGEVDAARRAFQVLLLDEPRFAPAWDGLGGCFDLEGNLEKAGEAYRKAIRLDRMNWRSRLNWGLALQRAGELKEAVRWLKDAARIAPAERRPLQAIGDCYAALGEWAEALRWLRRALEQPERDVSDAELYVRIGSAEAEQANWQAADEAYSKACLLSPEDPEVFYHWALTTARSGDPENAQRLGGRAQALDPRSLRYRMFLIELAADQGDWPGAQSRIDALSRLPGTERLRAALSGELKRRQNEAEAARRLALQALSMEGPPSDQAVDSALATLRRLRGITATCRGFRLLVEADCGAEAYYRPFVVLAEDEDQARWFVAELQDALDACPWRICEADEFTHQGEALAGVYQVLLTSVLFPKDEAPARSRAAVAR
ncbi:MAG TPA: tetratricopeptide repeat protein [Armatimonadota bacterium]|nr:tetratricopeptide repeat protein [Armatimonadota bacterium]